MLKGCAFNNLFINTSFALFLCIVLLLLFMVSYKWLNIIYSYYNSDAALFLAFWQSVIGILATLWLLFDIFFADEK